MSDIQKTFAVLLLFMSYDASSTNQFRMIHGNDNNYTVEDLQREEDLAYPRRDERIMNVLREKWAKYYKCLQEKENQEKKPEIRRLLEGQYTEFQCDFCPRPFQDYEQIEWKYKPLSPEVDIKDVEYLDLTPEMTLTTNKTLKIFNANENFAGLYVCYQKKNLLSVYILEVSRNDSMERVETTLIRGKHSMVLEEKHYQIYYQWTQWTECSVCGRVGKKFKYGTCFVSLKPEPKIFFNISYNITGKVTSNGKFRYGTYRLRKSMTSNSLKKSDKVDEFTNPRSVRKKPQIRSFFEDHNFTSENCINQKWDSDIIEKFSTGTPCASQYLPIIAFGFVQKHKAVKVLVKYCWEPCQENEIFEVLDNSRKIVERANNSAGIYSIFQTPPHLPPNTERRSIAAEFGKDITIHCPGTSLRNKPVIWKVNNKTIFPDIVANDSNGRFTIDLVHRIHIKKLRLKDSRIYSCWQHRRLVGTVHLNVEKKFEITFDHHVTLIGIVAIIGILLMMGSKILTRELQMRNK